MFKKKLERCTAVVLTAAILGSGLPVAVSAEDTGTVTSTESTSTKPVAWQEANESYSNIVSAYVSGVTTFKTESQKNILIDISTDYNEVVTMLDGVITSLNDELTVMDYTKINATYVYAITTVREEVVEFQSKVSALKKSYSTSSDNYSKLSDEESLVKNLDSMIRDVIGVKLYDFITKYKDNNQYSDEISLMLELDGGTYGGEQQKTFKGYTGNTVLLTEPIRKGYIFKGWKLVAGDCAMSYKNYTYTITYGAKNSILQAEWESDGTVVETPKPTSTPTPTPEPSKEPIIRNITVYIDLNGCEYEGVSELEKTIQESTTTVLFENVNLIQKEGYKVSGFECRYGKCIINPDGKVLYTTPSYATANMDTVKVLWEVSENPTEDNKNIVTVDLSSGVFISSGKETETIVTNVNETSILFNVSDIKREGYKLTGFVCSDSDSSNVYVQDGKIILINTAYIKGGIVLTAQWEEVEVTDETIATEEPVGDTTSSPDVDVTEQPDAQETVEPVPTTEVDLKTKEPVVIHTATPTVEPTATPTVTPNITATPTVEPTATPTVTPIVTQTVEPTTKPTAEPVKESAPAHIDAITVVITPKPPTLKLSKDSLVIGKSEKVQITSSSNSEEAIIWTSEDNSIAVVDANGNIAGKGVGSTTITAQAGVTVKKVNVTVKLAPLKLGLDKSMKTKTTWKIKKGKKKQIALYFSTGAYSNSIQFKSKNTKIATVSDKGLIKAKKKGKVTIIAKTYNGKKATIKLLVK